MIWRGLQYLFGYFILLGAAPLFGQANTANMPTYVVLQDMTRAELNGLYLMVGTSSTASGYVFQRFTTENQTPQWWLMLNDQISGGIMSVIIRDEYPVDYGGTFEYTRTVSNAGVWPASSTGTWNGLSGNASITGTAIFNWGSPPNPDSPYEEAFPDWESAGVLIPLGFGFGMMFWASALALHVPMKWVRSLADAAS